MNECPYCRAVLAPHALRCPNCQYDLTQPAQGGARPKRMTVVEPVHDLGNPLDSEPSPGRDRRPPPNATAREEPGLRPRPAVKPTIREETLGGDSAEDDRRGPGGGGTPAVPFRPVRRPRMVLLCALDDGRKDGEWIRIRRTSFSIGRDEGDLTFPLDNGISRKHAVLECRFDGGHCWYLKDLGTTNGTFVRCLEARLRNQQDILIGSTRFRFQAPSQGASTVTAPGGHTLPGHDDNVRKVTQAARRVDLTEMMPSLLHLDSPDEGEHRFYLSESEHWIGTDPGQSTFVMRKDPMASPRHARFYRDGNSRWFIEDGKSLNGTWLRINEELALEKDCEFQLGEQRFLVRLI